MLITGVMKVAYYSLIILILNLQALSASAELQPETIEQAIGSYGKGELTHATTMPESGVGFINLFRSREHYYATQGLVEIVEKAAGLILKNYPNGERLQVGDSSQEHGGPAEGHGSHQNGLDVDFIYFNNKHVEQSPSSDHMKEIFVKNGKVTKNFDVERNWALFRILVSSGRVTRMFVDPVIKKTMCDFARKRDATRDAVETLRRLRPYPNHANHVHVRLSCPAGSPRCVAQEEVAPGSGCGKILPVEQISTTVDEG